MRFLSPRPGGPFDCRRYRHPSRPLFIFGINIIFTWKLHRHHVQLRNTSLYSNGMKRSACHHSPMKTVYLPLGAGLVHVERVLTLRSCRIVSTAAAAAAATLRYMRFCFMMSAWMQWLLLLPFWIGIIPTGFDPLSVCAVRARHTKHRVSLNSEQICTRSRTMCLADE